MLSKCLNQYIFPQIDKSCSNNCQLCSVGNLVPEKAFTIFKNELKIGSLSNKNEIEYMKNVIIAVIPRIFKPKIGIKIKIDGFSDIAKERRNMFCIIVKSKNKTKNNIEIIKNSMFPLSNEQIKNLEQTTKNNKNLIAKSISFELLRAEKKINNKENI